MAILINFFDNVILQAISEEIVPKVSFFKDRYFPTGAGDIFKANEVLTEYRSGDRKLAAFVDQKAGDIPIGRRSYEVHSYKPAYIAPSRLLTLDELTKRGFGEALYPGMDEAQRAARLLADDMNDMENRIARRTLRIVYQNIVFALAIKFACLVLGALGLASMWTAIFADVGVMVLAVLNATRALYTKDLAKKNEQ